MKTSAKSRRYVNSGFVFSELVRSWGKAAMLIQVTKHMCQIHYNNLFKIPVGVAIYISKV